MKDHEKAIIINAIRDNLNRVIPDLPECLRELIHNGFFEGYNNVLKSRIISIERAVEKYEKGSH